MDASDKLKKVLGFTCLPHYSTLKYFADRSDTMKIVDAMLAEIVGHFTSAEEEVAIDSTGVEWKRLRRVLTSRLAVV